VGCWEQGELRCTGRVVTCACLRTLRLSFRGIDLGSAGTSGKDEERS
jgi:hypothetical protein